MARTADNSATQVVTEAVLVSGVTPYGGTTVDVTLTAGRAVGAPTYLSGEYAHAGDRLRFIVRQSSTGSYALTWNAIYKAVGISQTASATGVDVHGFVYDGTNWIGEHTLKGVVA